MTTTTSSEEKLLQVTDLLQKNWVGTEDWGEISKYSGQLCPKKVANKFLLCCLLDYQIKWQRAWENGVRLVQTLGDPDDIWTTITSQTEQESRRTCPFVADWQRNLFLF